MQRLRALQSAQHNTEHIRNICIIAHVDHGTYHIATLDPLGDHRLAHIAHRQNHAVGFIDRQQWNHFRASGG